MTANQIYIQQIERNRSINGGLMSHHRDNPNAVQKAASDARSKYSKFHAENRDQFIGYEAGQHDGASATFETIARWIKEDVELGIFDAERYIETLRRRAKDPFVSKVKT